MKKFSSIALGAALVLGVAGGAVIAEPAAAQKQKPVKLSKEVQSALAQAQKLQQAGDLAGATAQLQAADAAKKTPDDAYMVNAVKINVALAAKDNAMLEQAIEGALASGKVPAEDQPKFIRNLGALAVQRNDYAKATQQFERLAQLTPNDSEVTVQLAELYQRTKQTPKAVAMLRQAIDAKKASGQPVPEAWYKRQLAIAYDAKLASELPSASAALVAAYPTPSNWRDSIVIFREVVKLDNQADLDAMRLLRAAGALAGERDYAEYAESASQRGLPGEAVAVLDEGVAKGALNSSKPYVKELRGLTSPKVAADKASLTTLERDARGPKGTGKTALATADGYLSYGNWAKAAELYQLALKKGGVDAATANTRLGIALARAGRKAEAEAAFKAVQGGARQQLAQYWLVWLGQQA